MTDELKISVWPQQLVWVIWFSLQSRQMSFILFAVSLLCKQGVLFFLARTETTHCTEYMHSILLQDCMVPGEDQFEPLLDYYVNLISAGLSAEGIYLLSNGWAHNLSLISPLSVLFQFFWAGYIGIGWHQWMLELIYIFWSIACCLNAL